MEGSKLLYDNLAASRQGRGIEHKPTKVYEAGTRNGDDKGHFLAATTTEVPYKGE
jgi:hypothetical protein